MTNKTSVQGQDMIKHYESIHDGNLKQIGYQPKLCPAGDVTIGWGHLLLLPNGKPMKNIADVAKYYPQYATIDLATADKLFAGDLVIFENGVNGLGLQLNQSQFDALVSFCFNEGIGALRGSTLLKRIKGVVSSPDIQTCFEMWNKGDANGDGKLEVMPGLTFRRRTEALLFNTSTLKYFN